VWYWWGLFYYLKPLQQRRCDYFTVWTARGLFYALWLNVEHQRAGCWLSANGHFVGLKQWCVVQRGVFLLWGKPAFSGTFDGAADHVRPVSCSLMGVDFVQVRKVALPNKFQIQLPVLILIGVGAVFLPRSAFSGCEQEKMGPYVVPACCHWAFFLLGVFYSGQLPSTQQKRGYERPLFLRRLSVAAVAAAFYRRSGPWDSCGTRRKFRYSTSRSSPKKSAKVPSKNGGNCKNGHHFESPCRKSSIDSKVAAPPKERRQAYERMAPHGQNRWSVPAGTAPCARARWRAAHRGMDCQTSVGLPVVAYSELGWLKTVLRPFPESRPSN